MSLRHCVDALSAEGRGASEDADTALVEALACAEGGTAADEVNARACLASMSLSRAVHTMSTLFSTTDLQRDPYHPDSLRVYCAAHPLKCTRHIRRLYAKAMDDLTTAAAVTQEASTQHLLEAALHANAASAGILLLGQALGKRAVFDPRCAGPSCGRCRHCFDGVVASLKAALRLAERARDVPMVCYVAVLFCRASEIVERHDGLVEGCAELSLKAWVARTYALLGLLKEPDGAEVAALRTAALSLLDAIKSSATVPSSAESYHARLQSCDSFYCADVLFCTLAAVDGFLTPHGFVWKQGFHVEEDCIESESDQQSTAGEAEGETDAEGCEVAQQMCEGCPSVPLNWLSEGLPSFHPEYSRQCGPGARVVCSAAFDADEYVQSMREDLERVTLTLKK